MAAEALSKLSTEEVLSKQAVQTQVLAMSAAIHEECAERNSSIGADEFIPILLFVISREEMPCFVALIRFTSLACNDDELDGQFGYYLSSIESCISFFQSTRTCDLMSPTNAQSPQSLQVFACSVVGVDAKWHLNDEK